MTPSPPFQRVLVANRGEIALRICRGLRELGVESVAVHSEADAGAAHVRGADRSVALRGTTAAESYLDVDQVLAAARTAGAEALHPGYGFLSENADFARAVTEAGLIFIGPDAEAMERLGLKKRARDVARAAGVPVVPGTDEDSGDEALTAAAAGIGFPLMVKASAGGGGKGMRLVQREADLADALAAGRREARAAFGDDHMILEKVIHPARHVEVQVFGDSHGNVVSLHERECSVQRRHQKVLEESPSPAVDEDLRERMGEAAVALARSVGYRNAGTVEFLLDDRGTFYFLEVNTRLQVEHPVTELVTGLDLLHLQVLVAAGASLEDLLANRDLAPRGHAVEARVYAEDPEHGFLPAAGILEIVREPEGPGIRVDSGVYPGCPVPVHYDPLLAKVIAYGPDRDTACVRLARALADSVYLGIPTNTDFLRRVVEHSAFRAGDLRTDFLDVHPELVKAPEGEPDAVVLAAAALTQALAPRRQGAASGGSGNGAGNSASPWSELQDFRLWGGKR